MGTSLQPVDMLVPGANLESYIQAVSGIPILTVEEERALADRLHDENDLEAARHMVMSHLRFVIHIAKSYAGYGLAQADLIQEGNVGLMKAVKRFDPEYGVRLVSFAVHWIKAEIHEFILKNWQKLCVKWKVVSVLMICLLICPATMMMTVPIKHPQTTWKITAIIQRIVLKK